MANTRLKRSSRSVSGRRLSVPVHDSACDRHASDSPESSGDWQAGHPSAYAIATGLLAGGRTSGTVAACAILQSTPPCLLAQGFPPELLFDAVQRSGRTGEKAAKKAVVPLTQMGLYSLAGWAGPGSTTKEPAPPPSWRTPTLPQAAGRPKGRNTPLDEARRRQAVLGWSRLPPLMRSGSPAGAAAGCRSLEMHCC